MTRIILIFICFSFIGGCSNSIPDKAVLFDFELDAELDQLYWKCHTLFHLSREHVTHGDSSLEMELYPSEYPGFNPILKRHDWKKFDILCFDIYNPQEKVTRIIVRIDDKEDANDYYDRYNHSFMLEPGLNHIELNLSSFMTSGKDRKLNLSTIKNFLIFLVSPKEKTILYLDYIRLVS